MQARQMLIDGEISTSDWKQAARFIALISQAEGVKFIPELLSENGQKIINECSEKIKLQRKLKLTVNKFNDKRNSFDEMKVDSHQNVTSSTTTSMDKETLYDNRHLEKFILENYLEHIMFPNDDDTQTIASKQPDDFLLCVAREHQKIHNMSQSSAKYWLLEEFSTLQHFGEETFEGTLISESESKITQAKSEKIQIAVNPQGLNVKKLESNQTFSIPFSAVESAKSLRRCFHLCYLNESYTDSSLVIKFTSHRIAGTLYRALTEKHSFYSCETVHKNVETQFIRDLKVGK